MHSWISREPHTAIPNTKSRRERNEKEERKERKRERE